MRPSELVASVLSQPDNSTIQEVDGKAGIIAKGVMLAIMPLLQAALTDGTLKLPAGTGTNTSTAYAPAGTTLLRGNYSANQNFTLSGDTLTAGSGGGVVEYGGLLIKAGATAAVTMYVSGANTNHASALATSRLFLADPAATITVPADENTSSGAELSVWLDSGGQPRAMAHSYPDTNSERLVYTLTNTPDTLDNGGRIVLNVTPTTFDIRLYKSDGSEVALNADQTWHNVTRKTTGDLKVGFVTQNANAMAKNPQLTIS